MGKIHMAVCDRDDAYRNRFVTYLVEHKAGEFAVSAYSAAESFLGDLSKNTFDIALLGGGFGGLAKEVRGKDISVLLLKEDAACAEVGSCKFYEGGNDIGGGCTGKKASALTIGKEGHGSDCGAVKMTDYNLGNNCHGSDADMPDRQNYRVIYKYQPMEQVLREVANVTGQMAKRVGPGLPDIHRLEVIGVYSPIRHEMQMPFTLVSAAQMAERQRVLYLNLMENAAFMEIFGLDGDYDMGDIVIQLRGQRLNRDNFFRSVYEANSLSYIPPFRSPDDLHEFSPEDFVALQEFLEEDTNFEVLLVDFGEGVERLPEFLASCSSVICPVRSGYYYDCQINRFQNYMERAGGAALLEKIRQVRLPYAAKGIRYGGDILRQLVYSEFGDAVRGYMMGGMLAAQG